jgi:membrane protease YdiL (CAAX protease family)
MTRTLVMLPAAWLVFFAASAFVKKRGQRGGPVWRASAIAEILLALVALDLAFLEGMGLRELGFVWPARAVWGSAIGGGLILGALATSAMLGFRLRGLRSALSGYSMGALLVWAFIVPSICEEIFCRGWFQASTGSLLGSALLFGGMHAPLRLAGIDGRSVTVIVIATTLLGLLAAWARAVSGSLYPAIAAHLAFNFGGALFGIADGLRRSLSDSDAN